MLDGRPALREGAPPRGTVIASIQEPRRGAVPSWTPRAAMDVAHGLSLARSDRILLS